MTVRWNSRPDVAEIERDAVEHNRINFFRQNTIILHIFHLSHFTINKKNETVYYRIYQFYRQSTTFLLILIQITHHEIQVQQWCLTISKVKNSSLFSNEFIVIFFRVTPLSYRARHTSSLKTSTKRLPLLIFMLVRERR